MLHHYHIKRRDILIYVKKIAGHEYDTVKKLRIKFSTNCSR